jgi:hypothetical protein
MSLWWRMWRSAIMASAMSPASARVLKCCLRVVSPDPCILEGAHLRRGSRRQAELPGCRRRRGAGPAERQRAREPRQQLPSAWPTSGCGPSPTRGGEEDWPSRTRYCPRPVGKDTTVLLDIIILIGRQSCRRKVEMSGSRDRIVLEADRTCVGTVPRLNPYSRSTSRPARSRSAASVPR